MLAGDDLDQQFAADLAGGVIGLAQLFDLLGLERRRVVRMVKAQHLDAVIDRPFDEPAADILAELEAQRPAAGQLDRTGNPEIADLSGIEQRVAAILVVEQHAVAVATPGHAHRGLHGQTLER